MDWNPQGARKGGRSKTAWEKKWKGNCRRLEKGGEREKRSHR
jgi:hypothetical protein